MNRFREYKGIISNIVLVITTTILVPYFSNESLAKDELKLTDGILLIAVILLLFERKINQNILVSEINSMNEKQMKLWSSISKSWYFGLIILFTVTWRSYFKIIIIAIPFVNWMYGLKSYPHLSHSFYLKTPYWFAGTIVLVNECLLIYDILLPKKKTVSAFNEIISRLFYIILISILLSNFYLLFKSLFYSFNPDVTSLDLLFSNAVFLILIFNFFYLPIRIVDVLSDVFDCKSLTQLTILSIILFWSMLEILKPGITLDLVFIK